MSDTNKDIGKKIRRTAGVVLGTCVVAGGAFMGTKALLPYLDTGSEIVRESESEKETEKAIVKETESVKKTKDIFVVSAKGVTEKEPQSNKSESESANSESGTTNESGTTVGNDNTGGSGTTSGSDNTGGSGTTGGNDNTGGSGTPGGSDNTGGSGTTGGSDNTGGSVDIPAPPQEVPEPPAPQPPETPSTETPPEEPPAWSDTFVFADSDARYLSEEELYNLSSEEISIARNELFARKGRTFTKQKWIDYFGGKSWYAPTYAAADFDARMFEILNEYEQANLKLILAYEEKIA